MRRLAPFLRTISIFRRLKPAELRQLIRQMQVKAYPAGASVFLKGEKAEHMFVLLSGRVKIFSRSPAKMRTTFAFLGPGDFFGEMALISAEPRSACAEATEDSRILLLHKQDFARLLRTNAPFCCDMLRIMSERLRHADEQIENLLFQNILGRLSKILCQLAREGGRKMRDGVLIRAGTTRQELAEMVGTTREPLSRALATLKRAQFLRLGKDGILLSNPKKIQALAGIADADLT